MNIMFLKMTYFGKTVNPGDILDVSEADGKRLVSRGIAAKVEEVEPEQIYEPEVVEEVVEEAQPSLDKMATKELFELCKAQGLELEKKMINGKTDEERRAYLLSMLNKTEG